MFYLIQDVGRDGSGPQDDKTNDWSNKHLIYLD